MSSISVEEAYILQSKAIKPWMIALFVSLFINVVLAIAIMTSSTVSESYLDASELVAEDLSTVAKVVKE